MEEAPIEYYRFAYRSAQSRPSEQGTRAWTTSPTNTQTLNTREQLEIIPSNFTSLSAFLVVSVVDAIVDISLDVSFSSHSREEKRSPSSEPGTHTLHAHSCYFIAHSRAKTRQDGGCELKRPISSSSCGPTDKHHP